MKPFFYSKNAKKEFIMRERKLQRLSGYDYSTPGAYFVTICVHRTLIKSNVFGKINDGVLILNEYGNIVNDCWNDTINHYPCVQLNEYVVMPDHFHGIIHIIGNDSRVVNDSIAGNGTPVGNGHAVTFQGEAQ